MITVPPMLQQHRHLPQQNGLTVPFITAFDQKTQRYRFGINDAELTVSCLMGRLCGMCGTALEDVKVLMVADENFPIKATPEPALHVWCAWYASRACPMLNGSMKRYGPIVPDDIFGDGSVLTPGRGTRQVPPGTPAAAWYQLWVRGDYRVGVDHLTRLPAWLVWKGLPEIKLVKLREPAGRGGEGQDDGQAS